MKRLRLADSDIHYSIDLSTCRRLFSDAGDTAVFRRRWRLLAVEIDINTKFHGLFWSMDWWLVSVVGPIAEITDTR